MLKRKKKQKQTTEFYAIEILDWDLDYGINFSPDRLKYDLDVETHSLACHGKWSFLKTLGYKTLWCVRGTLLASYI